MTTVEVLCAHCSSNKVVKNGKAPSGIQRFLCSYCRKSFQQDFVYNGNQPSIEDKIIEMAMNGSGVRDTSRVLSISQNTVIVVLKNSHLNRWLHYLLRIQKFSFFANLMNSGVL